MPGAGISADGGLSSRLGAMVKAGGRFISAVDAFSVVYVPGPGIGIFDSLALPRPVMLNIGAALLLPSFASPSTGGIEYSFGAEKKSTKLCIAKVKQYF